MAVIRSPLTKNTETRTWNLKPDAFQVRNLLCLGFHLQVIRGSNWDDPPSMHARMADCDNVSSVRDLIIQEDSQLKGPNSLKIVGSEA